MKRSDLEREPWDPAWRAAAASVEPCENDGLVNDQSESAGSDRRRESKGVRPWS